MIRTSFAPALIATAALLSPASAFAFKVKTTSKGAVVHWEEHILALAVVQTGNADKDALLNEAVRNAAAEWNRAADLIVDARLVPPGSAEVAFESSGPNQSVVKWAEGAWPYDPGTLALTFLRYDVDTGVIFDADVLINDSTFDWGDKMRGEGDDSLYDLQNTLTHELGHALGLAHSEVVIATMFASTDPADVDKRFLDHDDVAGAQTVYGEVLDGNRTVAIDPPGGCSAAGGLARGRGTAGGGALWALALFGVLGAFRTRRLATKREAAAIASGIGMVSLAIVLAVRPALAAQVANSENTVEQADVVVKGTVVAQRVEKRADDVIVTVSDIRVERCLAGLCPEVMVLEQLGGEVDGIGFWVEGMPVVGYRKSLLVAARSTGARWIPAGVEGVLIADLTTRAPKEIKAIEQRVAREWLGGHRAPRR